MVGVLEGRAPGRSLMFCGHIDTVGVAGMTRPFDPVERDGRLYGRGSQDMKGGIAAMVGAVRVLAESGGLDAGKVIIACVSDEEHASVGAEALVSRWRADAGVVTEPTDLQVAVAHKGFEWIEVETEGRAAHGSRPRDGRDAIMRMGRVLGALEALDRKLQAGRAHPLVGAASLHASLIEGGRELSSYPDRCSLQIERRTIPGEPSGSGAREMQQILDQLRVSDGEFSAVSRPMFSRAPYEITSGHQLPSMLLSAAKTEGAPARPHRNEFLDRCCDSRRGRHSFRALWPDRRGPAQSRGVGRYRLGTEMPRRARDPRPRLVPRLERTATAVRGTCF